MPELADASSEPAAIVTRAAPAGPLFVLLLEAPCSVGIAADYDELARSLGAECRRALDFEPALTWTALPAPTYRQRPDEAELERRGASCLSLLTEQARQGAGPIFLLPVSFDFGIECKQWLGEVVRTAQRRLPGVSIHHDAVNAAHPLLIGALLERALLGLARLRLRSPSDLGLLLIANGCGDADTRAESYRVMRLLWEQLGASRADVAFVRHMQLPLPEQLAACARSGLTWLLLPQFLGPCAGLDFAKVIYEDCRAQFNAADWQLAEPLGDHSGVRGWLSQRLLELYRAHRNKLDARLESPRHTMVGAGLVHQSEGEPLPIARCTVVELGPQRTAGVIAELSTAQELAELLAGFGVPRATTLIKPTWHGYATGTYTDPQVLGLLFSALPERAIVVEAHTTGRNDQAVDWDWERDAREHRAWIQEQEGKYLEKTGLLQVLHGHRARYVNVTEAWWDGACAPAGEVLDHLSSRNVRLHYEELASYVPAVLFEQRGAPFLSFARFKGPTRASLANLFGLLPQPLRSIWHGPNITYFARVCCDLAKLYGALFELYGLVESLHVAVRWDRRGLYRSRFGNYDLVPRPGIVCLGRGLGTADVLAARLQGQDVRRSAFFDVVGEELGLDEALVTQAIPAELIRRFV